MSETSDIQVPNASLELVLAQLTAKEQLCKELEGTRMTLQVQVQKLLHDNNASKSDLKKEKQWQLEKERLITDLDNANHALTLKEGRVHQLERDLNGARSAVESVQSKLKDTMRSKERESIQKEGLQADLEDARLAIVDLKTKCRLKDEASEKQRNALNDFSRKTELQKKILEQHLDEARRKTHEFEELQQEHQTVTAKLGEKDKQLLSLRENYEKLRGVHKGQQSEELREREEIVNSLEASEAKCGEQELKLWKLENELRKMKSKAKQLDTKSAAAETEANAKSILLKKVQTELDTFAASVAELAESKEQATVLKAKLTETEKDLAEETTLRLKAECALQDFKKREEHLLKVEEGHRELQGKAKWQNEQFQSLEEAYSKIRAQFEESQSLWETERTEMVREIDCLRDGLHSKSKRAQELCYQLDMLQQAFDHEQNHKKVLELELAEAKTGMELAAAESEQAHSALENLREETTAKMALLRSNVASQERQIKDMELKEKDFMQDYEELKGLHSELQNLKCSQDELRQTLRARDNHIKALEEAKKKSIEMARGKEIEREEEKDRVLKSLTDARVNLGCKDARLKELGVELDGAKFLINALQKSIAELEELHAEEKERVICTLEQTNENVKEREEVVRELKTELARIQVSLDTASSARANSEHQSEVMEEQLFQTRGELKAVTEAMNSLKESSKVESDSLLEALGQQNGKLQEIKAAHDAILGQRLVSFQEQEVHLVGFQKECQNLQQLMIHRDSEQKKIQEAHDEILMQLRAESKAWHDEKEKLVMELLTYEGQGTEQEKHRLEVQSDLERHKDVILKLEARCESLEQQMVEQRLLAELASGQLAIERAESERLKKESQSLNETFAAAISAKDVSLEQLRKSFHELEAEYSSSAGAVNIQTLQASSLENRLEEQQELQANLEAKFCVTFNQLQEMSQQLADVSTERDVVVKTLHEKESENADMRKESEALTAEIRSLEGFAKSVEEKKLELSKELEISKASIDKLCAALEVAEADSASGSRELKEIYNKLGYADTMSLQLQIAAEKAQEIEETLTETRATVEDKEERLAASEWAVQQLASEISKAKNSLVKKEREEAFLQERLSDLERHLRDKEREMAEMESYLDAVVQANDAKRADIDTLTLKMQDMKKGADEWKLREIHLETELNNLKNILEDKIAALEESKSEVQRASEVHQVMEEAIENLKRQLAVEGSERSARQGEMDTLCCELQIAKQTASLANTQLHVLHGKLQQLEQGSEDRIQKTQTISDEIHEELAATQFQLYNSETRLERAVSDLGHYKEKCAGLLETLENKNKAFDEMEVKLASAEVELARQARLVEKVTKERIIAHEQLHLQEQVQKGLENSVALIESQMEDMEIYKQEMEQEVKKLKKALDVAKRDSVLKTQEAAGYKSHIEDLQEISGHYGDAQVMISRLTEELQMTSSTLEERDQRFLKLQVSLKVTEEELRASRETVAAMECEREVLSVKLTVADSQVENNQKQIAQIQQTLEVANNGLETETANVLFHIAEMKKVEVELDEWKEKAATLAEEGSKVKGELEHSLKDLETELLRWKGKHEEGRKEKQQLETDMQLMRSELNERKENAEVAAQEGRAVRKQLETSIKELQNCCEGWKQIAETAEKKGRDVKLELEHSLHALQAELRDLQDSAVLESAAKSELERVVKTLEHDLGTWKEEAVRAAEMGSLTREDFEISMTDLRAELEEWKEKAGTAQDAERILRVEFGSLLKELQTEVEVWKNTAASAAEAGTAKKLELESSVQDLRLELDDWKKNTSARVDEDRTVKMTLETTIVEFQAEIEEWKKTAATAAEESRNMQAAFEFSVKEIQMELQVWKEKATCAAEEGSSLKKEVQELKTEVIGWQERAETSFERGNSEILDINKSITETQSELTEQKGATAVAEETKSLHLELQQSLKTIADLTAQMEAQKAKESLVEKLTEQLESDLMTAREEAMTRKEKMLHILAQLESTHASQKELQAQLQVQHKRLLHEDELAGYSFVEAEESFGLAPENNVKRSLPQLESPYGLVKANNRLEEEASVLRAKALESQHEARRLATVLEAALTDLSGRNLGVSELKFELSGLRSFLRKLELKGGSSEQAITLAVDRGENDGEVENTKFRKGDKTLQLCDSFVRDSGGQQKCDLGARVCEQKRRGNAQTTARSPPYKAKSPCTQLTNSSPRPDQSSPSSNRKRNVASPLSKPVHRVSVDASICKILGEIDENSPTANSAERFQRQSPIQLPKKRVSNDLKSSSSLHMGPLF